MSAALVSAHGVTKRFPGVVANDGVDLEVRAGEVHTVLGENGAGKSTLAAILCGLYRPDEGHVAVRGEPVLLDGPRHGLQLGIAMVHQHFRLVERCTVAENVVLGDRSLRRRLSMRDIEDRVASVAESYGLPVDPRARIDDLAVGQRQRVEIVKALYRDADVLLLDEPTAVLAPVEVEALFTMVRAMTAADKAVVFISHRLAEVTEISDRITVMRDGRVTGEVEARGTDRNELARLMVGRDVDLAAALPHREPGEVRLSVAGLTLVEGGRTLLDGIDLEVRAGEIVGIAGVSGNGQRELAEVISGMRRPSSGRVRIGDVDATTIGPRRARDAGLAFVPEERLGTGLAPSLSIADNMLLTRPRGWLVDRRRAADDAREVIDRFDVKAPGPATPARRLSGGNAQKVLLGRELTSTGDRQQQTEVLVVASPTRGLDVGAIEAVRTLIGEHRDAGVAVLLISEDLDEVMSMSDRVLVLFHGAIAMRTTRDEATIDELGRAMAGL